MDLVLLYGMGSGSEIGRLSQTIRQRWCLPIIVLLPRDAIPALDSIPSIDDFVVAPGDPIEVSLRVKRILRNATALEEHEVIQSGDLVIDTAKCEVSVGGSVVPLTFKEYELLRLLASHKGRVLTRQVLLSKLWGDQYYGGDRTVDVHIRRLRSKIEDQQNTFIVTVRNVGYKFKPAG
ncbi:MAG: response regulator transcription factor [Chloroflexi bacterium]|nr:response regulator transcription factor [Chloroflexota bacterium]